MWVWVWVWGWVWVCGGGGERCWAEEKGVDMGQKGREEDDGVYVKRSDHHL